MSHGSASDQHIPITYHAVKTSMNTTTPHHNNSAPDLTFGLYRNHPQLNACDTATSIRYSLTDKAAVSDSRRLSHTILWRCCKTKEGTGNTASTCIHLCGPACMIFSSSLDWQHCLHLCGPTCKASSSSLDWQHCLRQYPTVRPYHTCMVSSSSLAWQHCLHQYPPVQPYLHGLLLQPGLATLYPPIPYGPNIPAWSPLPAWLDHRRRDSPHCWDIGKWRRSSSQGGGEQLGKREKFNICFNATRRPTNNMYSGSVYGGTMLCNQFDTPLNKSHCITVSARQQSRAVDALFIRNHHET